MIDMDNILLDIAKHFNLPIEQLKGRQGGYITHSTARHIAWYILHCDYKYTINNIALVFSRTPNTIKKGVAQIKNGLKFQPYYKKLYNETKRECNA